MQPPVETSELVTDVVALYVDPRGPYPGIVADWYDEARDARTYAGPHPVICHPPCGPWSSLRHLWTKHQGELAPIAIEQVRKWGGVLEHPANSTLWECCGLPLPWTLTVDSHEGRSIEVDQCNFGHPARKRTWLYIVRSHRTPELPPRREPTHWCSGGGTGRGKTPPGIKVCSAQQRRRTPPAFARWLVELARGARRPKPSASPAPAK